MKIIGIELKEGEFQGRKYSNYVIHGYKHLPAAIGENVTETVKIKSANLLSMVRDQSELRSWIGKEIEDVFYDKYGNAVSIRFKQNIN